ncbi:MAG: flagellin [Pseudomonadota bacterium]
MNNLGIPDLLSSLQLQRQASSVNQSLARAGEELTTGLTSNIGEAVQGNPQKLYAIERDITLNQTYATSISTAASRAAITQSALELVQQNTQEIGADLLTFVERGEISPAEFEAAQARSAFESTVAALNNRFGDRSLFAGAAVDGLALASADDILADIQALTIVATDTASVVAAVETYFNDPAGFDATGYQGSTNDAPAVELGEGERVDYAIRADNAELKEAIKGLVLAVVGSDPAFFAGTDAARLGVMATAAETSIAATDGVIRIRSELGFAEARIETATVRNRSEADFLAQARNAIIARDQFEAAAEFSALELQLQSIFSVTARMSQLSLNNFLR